VSAIDCCHAFKSSQYGQEPLNIYLNGMAGQNERHGGSRTYVIAGRDSRVVGYYTLAVGSVEHANAPAAVKKGLGQYPIPVIILARLATDKSIHGKGFGLALLKDALKMVYNVSRVVGVRAVLVHAKEYVDLSCESSREIAARIGVVQWTIWDWLVGKRQPKAKSLMKLRRFLDNEAKRPAQGDGIRPIETASYKITKPLQQVRYARLCPFCRKERGKIRKLGAASFQGACPECGATGPKREGHQEALRAWNGRE
jgi:GNAT superfamily N-acetyltransferase